MVNEKNYFFLNKKKKVQCIQLREIFFCIVFVLYLIIYHTQVISKKNGQQIVQNYSLFFLQTKDKHITKIDKMMKMINN